MPNEVLLACNPRFEGFSSAPDVHFLDKYAEVFGSLAEGMLVGAQSMEDRTFNTEVVLGLHHSRRALLVLQHLNQSLGLSLVDLESLAKNPNSHLSDDLGIDSLLLALL